MSTIPGIPLAFTLVTPISQLPLEMTAAVYQVSWGDATDYVSPITVTASISHSVSCDGGAGNANLWVTASCNLNANVDASVYYSREYNVTASVSSTCTPDASRQWIGIVTGSVRYVVTPGVYNAKAISVSGSVSATNSTGGKSNQFLALTCDVSALNTCSASVSYQEGPTATVTMIVSCRAKATISMPWLNRGPLLYPPGGGLPHS